MSGEGFSFTDAWLGAPIWGWCVFAGSIALILSLDLAIISRRAATVSLKRGGALAGSYAALAIAFGCGVWFVLGPDKGALFLSAYLLEQLLSVDNVFVMSAIFSGLSVPRHLRRRVLFWGILMAMLLRGIFIFTGIALVNAFEWLLYGFAFFLIFGGVSMLRSRGGQIEENRTPRIVTVMSRFLPLTDAFHGRRFFVRKSDPGGALRVYATPLFLAFMSINVIDVVFAVDSVPVVISMTRDLFIVYTSNIFAVVGLRALYFLVDALIARFAALAQAVAVLLILVGGKILYEHLIEPLPPWLVLGVTLSIILGTILHAIRSERKRARSPNS